MWLRIESDTFAFFHFLCLAVICPSSTYSWQHVPYIQVLSYVIMHMQQICACDSSHPLVTFYIPDWRCLHQLYSSSPSPYFRLWLFALSKTQPSFLDWTKKLCDASVGQACNSFSAMKIASACVIDLLSVIKGSNLDSLNRCMSNYIYRFHYNTNFSYDWLHT